MKDTPASSVMNRPEIGSLTSLRGYLAIWVVAYHFWNDWIILWQPLSSLSPLAEAGSMAVPAFFMLSGFVLAYNYSDRFAKLNRREYFRFLSLRLARIYPVHLVTLLIVLAMAVASWRLGYRLTDEGYSFRFFVLNLLLMQTWTPDFILNWNYPSWSISSEWFAYLLFPLLVYGGLKHLTTPLRTSGFLGVSVAGSLMMIYLWRPWPFYELLLVLPTFSAGMAACFMLRKRPEQPLWWSADILAILTMATPFLLPDKFVRGCMLICLLGLIITLGWQSTRCSWLWRWRPAIQAGEISYSLYMTHTLAQKILTRLLPVARFQSADLYVRLGVLAVDMMLIIACCLATYLLIEHPCRVFFKKVSGKSRGQCSQSVLSL